MTEACVGCGAAVETIEGPVHRYMTASPGCWARYGELLAVLSAYPALQVARQCCVDAYAAQHPGTDTPQAIQSVALHLVSLCSYLKLGRPVTDSQDVIRRLLRHKDAYKRLQTPSFASTRTIVDMPATIPPAMIPAEARAWAQSVWAAWLPHHAQVAEWYAAYGAS